MSVTAGLKPTPVERLVLFGATGDLARRMLAPSLFGLHTDGLLPAGLRIVATARTGMDSAGYRNVVGEALGQFVDKARLKPAQVRSFLDRLSYVPADASDGAQMAKVAHEIDGGSAGVALFLSMAPSLFGPAITGLSSCGLATAGTRLALEKPLGYDLQSSRRINDAVATAFPEDRTFRVDHYLGKETVQNLMALRFGNALFEPLWNSQVIEHVQITVAETVGLEERGGYYDGMGALRDMVQNHMLQLVALVAMEPPAHLDPTCVRDEKVKVLRSLRPIDRAGVRTHTVTGQYQASGAAAAGYCEELGRASATETFVAIKAHVDNWRWKNVPFYLRTGKRMASRRSEIIIQFKAVPHSIFTANGAAPQSNKLVIQLQPEENVSLLMMAKQPGLDRDGIHLREVPLQIGIANAFAEVRRRIAYERLLLDLIDGDPTLFVRRDEVEAQWTWIDAIRDGWEANGVTPRAYAAGSWGPSAAIGLPERDGASWHD
ncbi:MAG: glucose-6-phosphate dehydrogenase [Hyphomonadaceae bacterium]|nr:glucose-6-phosphate dehydrogenase [Hyphomonadaceae bacterium]